MCVCYVRLTVYVVWSAWRVMVGFSVLTALADGRVTAEVAAGLKRRDMQTKHRTPANSRQWPANPSETSISSMWHQSPKKAKQPPNLSPNPSHFSISHVAPNKPRNRPPQGRHRHERCLPRLHLLQQLQRHGPLAPPRRGVEGGAAQKASKPVPRRGPRKRGGRLSDPRRVANFQWVKWKSNHYTEKRQS